MTKHIDRLMSRASVAAMATFAKEPTSTLPAFAERVDADAGDGGGSRVDPIDGLTAEEQAGLDAMKDGAEPPAAAEAGADDGGADDAGGDDDATDGAGDGGTDAPAEGTAPAEQRQAPKTVSYGKYQREKAKLEADRVALQEQLEGARRETTKEREERLRLDERTKVLLEAISGKAAPAAAPKEPDDPEPDGEEDPIAHAQWTSRELKRTQKIIADMRDGTVRDREQRQAVDADEQVLTAATNEISTAAGEAPEVADAFVHYRESRYTELGYALAGIDINDTAACAALPAEQRVTLSNEIQRHFRNDCLAIAKQAKAAGRPLVRDVLSYARARGWAPKPAEEAAPAAVPARTNGAAKPGNGAAPAPRAAPSVKDQLGAVRENLEASRSLSDAGGSPGAQMTPQRIADMSAAEFERYYESLPKDQFDRMMGKPDNM